MVEEIAHPTLHLVLDEPQGARAKVFIDEDVHIVFVMVLALTVERERLDHRAREDDSAEPTTLTIILFELADDHSHPK